MKPDIDKKFDSLRNAPTELSRQEVESIIRGLPALPAAPLDTANWTSWFSLNNLLVVAFVGALGAGVLLWNKGVEQPDVLTANELQVPPVEEDVPTLIDGDGAPETNEVIKATLNEIEPSVQPPLVEKIDRKPKESKELVVQQKVKEKEEEVLPPVSKPTAPAIKIDLESIATNEAEPAENLVENKTKPADESGKSAPAMIAVQQPTKTDPNAVPDLTNGEMRRLKKKLFENLLDDKLIINTWKAVEIDLPGNEIIVNGKVVDQSLFNKYSLLTKKVGWGPDRKIRFDHEYIKVGDFTATGFKGSGFGTFRSTPKKHLPDEGVSRESLVLKKEREIKKEQRELDAFAQTLLDTSVGRRRGRKNIMGANLKQEKCKRLHKELYEMLLEDGLIETKVDYVLVEISKNKIHINVLELNETLYEKYSELFDSYKIKPGPRRQIRMSEHTIRVGDFSRGSFTGTALILN